MGPVCGRGRSFLGGGSALLTLLLASCATTAEIPLRDGPANPSDSSFDAAFDGSGSVTAAETSANPGGNAAPEESSGWPSGASLHAALPVTGTLSSQYRLRWDGDDKDQDLFTFLSAEAGDPEKDPVTYHVAARASWDLDGQQDQSGGYVFDSITDSFDSPFNGRLYDAYADIHAFPEFAETLRLGRQEIYETPELAYFDGLRYESPEWTKGKVQVGVYGGLPVHLFESSPQGDRLLGTFVQTRPWQGGRLRADWMHSEDDPRLGGNRNNDLLSFGFTQRCGEPLLTEIEYSRIENEDRDVRARATWVDVEHDLTVQGSYYQLLNQEGALATEFDPFYAALLDIFPYYQFGLLVTKGLGERVQLQGGADTRRVTDESDIGQFNHDFDRYHLTAVLSDPGLEGTTLSLTGEVWDSTDDDVQTWGADLSQKISDDTKASLGTYYSLYKFDLYASQERENVWTYYVRIQKKLVEAVSLRLQYEFENSDLANVHTLRVGATWNF